MKRSSRWILLAIGLVLLGGVAYRVRHGVSASGQGASGWRTHQDPMGFSVSLPPGWRVASDRSTGRIEFQGAASESVMIWPVFLGAPDLDPASASLVAQRLAGRIWPEVPWNAGATGASRAVRLAGRRGELVIACALAWIPSAHGTAGYFYASSAPAARYRNLEETFARILASFRVTGTAAAQAAAPQARYVRWTDPRENAFSLEVPEGWQVSGGTFRFAPVDVRGAVEALSPDGQIRITNGDAELPVFTGPMFGFPEGSWYSPGYNVQLFVRRYVPGPAFSAEYIRTKAARGCSNLTLTETRDRPDVVQAINNIYAQYGTRGIYIRLTAGETAFTCQNAGQPMRGYYFAGTQLTQAAVWNVQYLCGYLAPADKAALAQSLLEHMVATVQPNPEWVAMQENIAANFSQIVSRTQHEISGLISSSYRNREATMDELSRRRSNATLGLEDVIDTATGRQIKVESSSNYYWIDQHGTIVGTNTDTRPNLDFRELMRLP